MTEYNSCDILGGMKPKKREIDLGETIREAFEASGMNRLALSRQSEVPYASVHGFVARNRTMTLTLASRLCEVLGLELRPVAKSRKRRKKKAKG